MTYTDAVMQRLVAGGTVATVLRFRTGNISFTHGDGPVKPLDLGALGMLVAPPVSDGSWPRSPARVRCPTDCC